MTKSKIRGGGGGGGEWGLTDIKKNVTGEGGSHLAYTKLSKRVLYCQWVKLTTQYLYLRATARCNKRLGANGSSFNQFCLSPGYHLHDYKLKKQVIHSCTTCKIIRGNE